MDYGYILAKSDGLKLKHLDGFDWTLILTVPIHCRGSIGEQVM